MGEITTHQRYTYNITQMDHPLSMNILMTLANDFSAFLAKHGEVGRALESGYRATILWIYWESSRFCHVVCFLATKLVNVVVEAQYNQPPLDRIMREEVLEMVGKARKSVTKNRGLGN